MTPNPRLARFATISGLIILAAASASAQNGTDGAQRDTATTASGLKYVMTHTGNGKRPQAGDLALVHYTGTLLDGTVFDSSRDREPFAFRLGKGQVIRGWDEGIALLRTGDRATFIIPANLAYGDRKLETIPPNSTLVFDVELIDIKKESMGDVLAKALDEGNSQMAFQRYQQLKKSNFDDLYMSEGELNMVGYKYLQGGKVDEAITIFRINADAFPASFNVYDSLGEAYMTKGEKVQAVQNYERSLELNPKNENAVEMLKKLNATR